MYMYMYMEVLVQIESGLQIQAVQEVAELHVRESCDCAEIKMQI